MDRGHDNSNRQAAISVGWCSASTQSHWVLFVLLRSGVESIEHQIFRLVDCHTDYHNVACPGAPPCDLTTGVSRPRSAVMTYFRTRLLCRNLQIRPNTGPIAVRYPSEKGEVTITLMPLEPIPDDIDCGMEATVLTKRAISGKPGQALQALAKQRLPPGSRVEPSHLADPEIQQVYFEYGTPPLDVLPQHLEELFTEVHAQHSRAARRTLHLLRWRHGLDVPTQPFAQIAADWSLDQKTWRMMPAHGKGRVQISSVSLGLRAAERMSEVQRLLDDRLEMPIGHELLLEAEEHAFASVRSSLVLSLAALEVGFKGLVSKLVPDAAWLVAEVPSPPLDKMLRDYLPLLPKVLELNVGAANTLTTTALAEVRKAMGLRNDLVHTGIAKIDGRWLDSWLQLCGDLLYLFDFYQGHRWALRVTGGPDRLPGLMQQTDAPEA
jgi:hypothetical protein